MFIKHTDIERLESMIDATILSKKALPTKSKDIYEELVEVFAVHVSYKKSRVYRMIRKRLKLHAQTPKVQAMTQTNEQLTAILKIALNKKRKQIEKQRRKVEMLESSGEEKEGEI